MSLKSLIVTPEVAAQTWSKMSGKNPSSKRPVSADAIGSAMSAGEFDCGMFYPEEKDILERAVSGGIKGHVTEGLQVGMGPKYLIGKQG